MDINLKLYLNLGVKKQFIDSLPMYKNKISYFILILFLMFIENSFCQSVANSNESRRIDSIKKLTLSKIDTIRFVAYSDLVWELKDIDKTEALRCATNLIAEAKISKSKKWEAQGYNDLGIIYIRNGNLDKALENITQSLNIRKIIGNKKDIVSSLSKIGNIYVEQLKYNEALSKFLECAKICEQEKFEGNLGMLYGNIANIYLNINESKLSLIYIKKALAIQKNIGDSNGMAASYSALGSVYADLNNIDSAKYYIFKAKDLLLENGLMNEYCTALNNLGLLYRKNNQSDKGIPYYIEAVKVSKELGDTSGYTIYASNLASVYSTTGKLQEAEALYLESIAICKKLNLNENLLKILKGTVLLYSYKNDPEKATYYFDEYNNLKDSLLSRDFNKQLSEQQTKYDVDIKDATILKNELEIERQQKSSFIKSIVIIVTIVLLLLGALLFMLFQKNQKTKQQLKQEQLINNAVTETEQQERERIARDLHDSVGQKLSVVKMQLSMKNADVNSSSKLLDEAIQDVRTVSHNLMPADLSDGFVSAIMQMTEQINYSTSNTKIELNVSESFAQISFTKQIELLLYRVIQEIINNALKYAQAEKIVVTMNYQNKIIDLVISDNGIGFNVEEIKDGIGLKNIKMRVLQLKGKLDIKSVKNNGTTFIITFKKES